MGLSDYWYKNAIIYCIEVDLFQDGDGDGIGDFRGLTSRLDYLSGLGVTCVWLLPFYRSPNLDNGYDVIDYYSVDPQLGTLGDFVEFVRDARDRGIHVLIDLVVNHTSDRHPWFRAACADRNSKYRDYYVWSDTRPETDLENMFPGQQEGIWSFDKESQSFYLHRFYSHQPDLNLSNSEVREEIQRIMGFWLELGVSGFRLDAAPFLIAMKAVARDPYGNISFDYLREFRDFLDVRAGHAVLLAEANVSPETVLGYFGAGDRLQMCFNFHLNQHLFLALAKESAQPLIAALQELPKIPNAAQWVNFVRNHDELDLGRLSEEERELCFEKFAPESNMRVYKRGIRRRLPPMLNDDQKERLVYSLLLTLPGTPVIRYGEEIGMGDDLSRVARDSVRTPMQWTPGENGGFSYAPRERLISSVISAPPFGYETVNVAMQQLMETSLLNWFEHAIRTRRYCPEFGFGAWEIIETDNDCVFAHAAVWRGKVAIAIHNLSGRTQQVTLDLGHFKKSRLQDLLGDRQYKPVKSSYQAVSLSPYGHRWLRLDDEKAFSL